MRTVRLAIGVFVVAFVLVLLAAAPPQARAVDDWAHVWEVVQFVRAQPPAGPVFYYLGDSIARESTVGDAAWTAQLQSRAQSAGRRADVVAFTLAAHNQTFGMDETVVAGLPSPAEGQPEPIVLIGVGISRFIGPPAPLPPARVEPPAEGELPVLSPWVQHHYDGRRLLSTSRKRELVSRWMERRWPAFRANRAANLVSIERTILACRAAGLRPVLVDLPLDLAAIGRGLDKPRSSYRSGCKALARQHGVGYISLQPGLSMPDKGFWDLHHLVRRGYTRWQSRLSDALVRLIPRPTAP
jgi:hypothetical protein